MPKRIQRKRTRGWKMPEDCVYVGRPTKWGNPFAVSGPDEFGYRIVHRGTFHRISYDSEADARKAAVRAYRKWFFLQREAKAELRGKDLCCWCPLDCECHADVLLEIANS